MKGRVRRNEGRRERRKEERKEGRKEKKKEKRKENGKEIRKKEKNQMLVVLVILFGNIILIIYLYIWCISLIFFFVFF